VVKPEKHDSEVLLTLERYRGLVLERARSTHAQRTAAFEKEDAAHARIEAELEAAYLAHRTTLARQGQPLSPESLRMAYHHARGQSTLLDRARVARDLTRARLEQSQAQLAARLEELKVIERLRDNRKRTSAKWQRRRAQQRLDELGIIKACQVEGRWPSAE
jgi:hypothetical protein